MWFHIIFTLSVLGSLELQHFLSSSITLTASHCFFPLLLFFKVTFSPSHSSLWAIGTICHYLWSWRHVFFSCLLPNPTISSSFLTSLSPPSHLLSSTLSPTQQEPHPISLSQCVSAYLSVYLRRYFGVACPCLAGSSHGHARTCPSSEATRLQRHILHTDFTSSHMEPTYGRHL